VRTFSEKPEGLFRLVAWTLLIALVFVPLAAPGSDVLWTAHVEPLLKEHCAECHNPAKAKSGLDVSSLQTLLRGGDRGTAVVAGRPDDSNLYKFLSAEADIHMPPGKRERLSEEESGLIRKWIQEMKVGNPPALAEGPKDELATHSTIDKPRVAWEPPSNMPPAQAVDRFLSLAWKLDKVEPAKGIEDAAFVRRIYLDLIGRIPNSQEAAGFASNRARDKRAQLVETLLASGEYARHMREIFDSVLMERRGGEWENRRNDQKWFAFLEDAFARNRPWNEVVRDLIVARPEQPEDRGAVWYLYERQNNAQAIAEALAPVVFGLQVKCAQCHDHMVAREIKQAHYWGMVAAFNRSKNVDTPKGPGVAESAIGGFVSFANLKKESQPALLTFFNGRTIDEQRPKEGEKETDAPELYLVLPGQQTEPSDNRPQRRRRQAAPKADEVAVPKFSRRTAFADAVTKGSPMLARAMVNRIWAMLFARGLVHPVDLMDSKHPASHPELLDWLARDFERSTYDVKRLVRTLCNTRAYQLDSRPARRGNAKSRAPETFARALDKPLTAEQLFRTLLVATGNQPDKDGKISGLSERDLRYAFIAQFPDLFPPEYHATLSQAMFLSNSPLFDQLLAPHGDNLAARLTAENNAEARVRRAFEAVFAREPDREELRECVAYLAARSPEAGVKQLLWAMLSSAEFQLNH
jgi:mono/diheme cytochrome c family protein